jgi:ribosome biogenesis protein YTM1
VHRVGDQSTNGSDFHGVREKLGTFEFFHRMMQVDLEVDSGLAANVAAVVPTEITEVQVSFVTELPEDERVSDAALSVPANLRRKALSELINHLLGDPNPPKLYDFMIDGKFLRTSIKDFLIQNSNLYSPEKIIQIQYVHVSPKPKDAPSVPHPDWVSALDSNGDDLIVSGCYDGVVRLWKFDKLPGELDDESKQVLQEPVLVQACSGHTGPVRDVAMVTGSQYWVSASLDNTVRVWSHDGISGCLAVGKASSTAVRAVDALPEVPENNTLKFVSGGQDKKLYLWSVRLGDREENDEDNSAAEGGRKKLKKNDESSAVNRDPESLTPVAALSGHFERIEAVCWAHPLAIMSVGWDDSIRLWDSATGTCTRSWSCGMSEGTSLSYSKDAETNLFASGHTDKTIRLWDVRVGETQALKLRLKSHQNWVTSVSWFNSNILTSTSRDGTTKFWDIRSTIPLHTVELPANDSARNQKTAGLSITCASKSGFVATGADDSRMHLHLSKL